MASMNVIVWYSNGCMTASYNEETRTLTNFPKSAMARIILSGDKVRIRNIKGDFEEAHVAWAASSGVAVLV